jgi:hypothetical protein
MSYIGEDGSERYAIWCENPAVCLHIAGMYCPAGYSKEQSTHTTHGWSFNAGGSFATGGTYSVSRTTLTIECKAPTPTPSEPTTSVHHCIEHYQGEGLPLTNCP